MNSHERFLDTSNETYNTGISKDHDDLPTLEELLFNTGKFKQAGLSSGRKRDS
jgi:hypothetical protein